MKNRVLSLPLLGATGEIPLERPMKKRFLRLSLLIGIPAVIGLGAVFLSRSEKLSQVLAVRASHQVLEDYADNVVLKTLSRVVDDVRILDATAIKLQSDPTDENLAATVAAWRTARASWELTQPLQFGPGNYYDYDKQLSGWPPDKVTIDYSLGEIRAGRLKVDPQWLRERKTVTLRGFHAAEYLLLKDGKPRAAKDLGAAELSYLTSVTQSMVEEAIDFEAAWRGTDNLEADKVAILQRAGMKKRAAFAPEFKNPGEAGSRYHSPSVALQDVFQEFSEVLVNTCPFASDLTESPLPADVPEQEKRKMYVPGRDYLRGWDYADLRNQLKGLENAYLGGLDSARGHSISELVAAKDRVLDQRVKIEFAHAQYRLAAIDAVPTEAEKARIRAAKIASTECDRLVEKLNSVTLQLTMDPILGPWAAYGR